MWALHDAFKYALQTEGSDDERITRFCRTIVDWTEEGVLYLCGASLASYDRLGVLHSAGQGGCDCGMTRERRGEEKMLCLWQESHIKRRNAPFPQLNVPLGGVREGEKERRKGYELTILVQGCRVTATKQREGSAVLISTANSNKLQPCFNHSHPLVAHPLGAKAVAAVLFLFLLPRDKYFPLVRLSSSMGKSPHAGQISTHSTKKPVLRICQHFWLCCQHRATFFSLKVMLARCFLEKITAICYRVAITFKSLFD